MTTHQSKVVMPHLQTEEQMARFNAAVEQRNRADFECFRVLKELRDNEMLGRDALRATLQADVGMGISADEADECADEWSERVARVLQQRRDADVEFSNALLGRP